MPKENYYRIDIQLYYIVRLKSILFPKVNAVMSTCASDQQNQFKNVRKASEGNINNEEKININAQQSATVTHYSSILEEQIRKLRQYIDRMILTSQDNYHLLETYRHYISTIARLSGSLHHYSYDLNTVFENFLEGLPIDKATSIDFVNQYYLTRLIANYITHKLRQFVCKRTAQAYKRIYSFVDARKRKRDAKIKSLQIQLRFINRKDESQMCKYFSRWRFTVDTTIINRPSKQFQQYFTHYYTNHLLSHATEYSLFIIMLQYFAAEEASACYILLYESSSKLLIQYVDSNTAWYSSSVLETVTNRSMLYKHDPKLYDSNIAKRISAIKRCSVYCVDSLTKICINKRYMLFVDNLYKHADFTNIDRPSLGSDESHKNAYLQHVLTVFSPLIVDNQVIAVLRQYYYQPSQHTQQRARSVSCKKLETMSNLLQYSLNVNTQLRDVHRELNYINKEYYQHFIKMVNHGQCSSERGEEILKNTLAELKYVLPINSISVYIVLSQAMSIKLSNQYDLLCDFVDPADTHAHESQNKQQLLQIVHQIVNRKEQGLCHVHLDDRLVLLIGNSVYDFHLHNENYKSGKYNMQMPVNLIVQLLQKILQIIVKKNMEYQQRKLQIEYYLYIKKSIYLADTKRKIEELTLVRFYTILNTKKKYIYIFPFLYGYLSEISNQIFQRNSPLKLYLRINSRLLHHSHKTLVFDYEECSQDNSGQYLQLLEESYIQYCNKNVSNMLVINMTSTVSLQIHFPMDICEINSFVDMKVVLYKIVRLYFEEYTSNHLENCYLYVYELPIKLKNHIAQFMAEYNIIYYLIGLNAYKFCQSYANAYLQAKKHLLLLTVQHFPNFILPIFSQHLNSTDFVCSLAEYSVPYPYLLLFESIICSKTFKCYLKLHSNYQLFTKNEELVLRKIFQTSFPKFLVSKGFVNDAKGLSYCLLSLKISNHTGYYFKLVIRMNNLFNVEEDIVELLENCEKSLCEACVQLIKHLSIIASQRKYVSCLVLTYKLKYMLVKGLKIAFDKCINIADTKKAIYQKTIPFQERLMTFYYKLLLTTLMKIRNKSNWVYIDRRNYALNYQYLQRLSTVTAKIMLKSFFSMKNRDELCLRLNRFYNRISKWIYKKVKYYLMICFNKIQYRSVHFRLYELFPIILYALFIKTKKHAFKSLQIFSSPVNVSTNYYNPFESSNLLNITQILYDKYPKYHAYIKLNEYQYLSLSLSLHILTTYQVLAQQQSQSKYDIICSGLDIIWYYPTTCSYYYSQKDLLNSLSKNICYEYNLCRQRWQLQLTRLNFYKRNFPRRMRKLYFCLWRKSAHQAMCIDQYHQNDKIYQLEVETQTMMEKLKLQEKRIKANCVTYDKLTHQKYEYQRRLEYYGYQIEQLEKDSKYFYLKRNIARTAYRKYSTRICFVLWRYNSLKIQLQEACQSAEFVQKCLSIGSRLVVRVINSRTYYLLLYCFKRIAKLSMFVHKRSSTYVTYFHLYNYPVMGGRVYRFVTFQEYDEEDIEYDYSNIYNQDSSNRSDIDIMGLKELDTNKYEHKLSKLKLGDLKNYQSKVELSQSYLELANAGRYKLNLKTLKFLKRMGKLEKYTSSRFFG